ncbi:MAG: hypothetical protein QM731_22650 [Chitinophagaceae bacterium]
MIQQNKGKIYLGEERGHDELDWFRSLHTFNFGQYNNEHKTPVGPLYILNEDTLAGKRSLTILAEEDSEMLLIPVVGAVTWQTSNGHSGEVEAGESVQLAIPLGTTINISNPYEEELVNFLQLWFHHPAIDKNIAPEHLFFDINANKNKLVQLPQLHTTSVVNHFIGCFDGRSEITHQLSKPHNALFVFVIQGAFEVQYRLLHPKDGLALWDLEAAELEALSNDAIILLSEITV